MGGMRLCKTQAELNKCCGTGCSKDDDLIWTGNTRGGTKTMAPTKATPAPTKATPAPTSSPTPAPKPKTAAPTTNCGIFGKLKKGKTKKKVQPEDKKKKYFTRCECQAMCKKEQEKNDKISAWQYKAKGEKKATCVCWEEYKAVKQGGKKSIVGELSDD